MHKRFQKLSVLCILLSLTPVNLLPTTPSQDSNADSSSLKKIRVKRNLGQLISLLHKDSTYKPLKLANYGNWCGKGGDMMGDGSYIDGCDLCCKIHDNCYNRTRHNFEGCTPLLTVYSYLHGQSHPVLEDVTGLTSSEERDIIHKRKLPTCLSRDNDAPSCKQSVCQCDVDFITCLKKEPCDPDKVDARGGYWWIPSW